jgi:tRNA modification GTPase
MTEAALPRDTIAAVATPPGTGGVGIVRVSGSRVAEIAVAVLQSQPRPRYATLSPFRDVKGAIVDHGLALYFPAPHSYTGEDVLELHGHGGPVVLDLLLQSVLAAGARPARPGEFTERAYLNAKLDLAQAEAVADLIESASAHAAHAALRSFEGVFSRRIQDINETLVNLRLHIEAALDFPEEEIDFLAEPSLLAHSRQLSASINDLLADTRQGQLLHDGMTIVLAGRPNAGKSSLLNLLAQRDSAIVSPIPGTTRDILREHIQIDGLPLHILDTAGLRESGDAVESEGVRRARAAMQQADRVLLIVDDSSETSEGVSELVAELPPDVQVTLVRNKVDISGRTSGLHPATDSGVAEVALSAKSGEGIEALRAHLKQCMGYQSAGEGTFSARRRHLEALNQARTHIEAASAQLAERKGELAAEELRRAQEALGEITGEFTSDDLLGRIFASFCIGK